ncbi:class GN sortase [Dokdonella sp.]|uniref:class GN sortase n=1 Tax=Dokdonella sp. TaxID=2291710 RepID=UPI003C35A657
MRLLNPRRCRLAAFTLTVAACVPLAHAGYMEAKAGLAQLLLQRAWQQGLENGSAIKPWPWADTAPIARLQVARLGISEIILRGDSGRTLAFGPGWAESSSVPGKPGLSVISAHRDTHFSFLRDLVAGDQIDIQSDQANRRYEVASLRVVDAREGEVELVPDSDALILVTCFPFDTFEVGGPLRFVVTAVPVAAGQAQPSVVASLDSSPLSIGAPRPPRR